MRKIFIFSFVFALILTGCKGNKTQSASGDGADFSYESFLGLLKNTNVESAMQCGLSFIYEDEYEPDDGDAGMYVAVYGRGVERGEKSDLGYELQAVSDHACYFGIQADTSEQAFICFKSKDDADAFFEKALEYGLVESEGSYYIPGEELPDGTVHVDTLNDYNLYAQISKPERDDEFHEGFYVIRIDYFA